MSKIDIQSDTEQLENNTLENDNIKSGEEAAASENEEISVPEEEVSEEAEKTEEEIPEENGAAEEDASQEVKASEEEGSAEEEASEEEDTPEEGKGGLFSGRKFRKELRKKEQELLELNDRYKRTLAEYDNFRKRTEKEKSDLYAYAVRDVMTKILPVLDNLERGMAAIPEDQRDGAVASGMEKILKQFEKTLDDIGVKPIEAEGKPFDPAYHNAVMHVEDEELGENTVAEEFMKGYTYKDNVIRCAMVKVAN